MSSWVGTEFRTVASSGFDMGRSLRGSWFRGAGAGDPWARTADPGGSGSAGSAAGGSVGQFGEDALDPQMYAPIAEHTAQFLVFWLFVYWLYRQRYFLRI